MFPLVLAGLFLLVAIVVLAVALRDADPAKLARRVKRSGRWVLFGAGGAVLLFLVATGKIAAAAGALIAASPLILRALDAARRAKAQRGPSAGGASDVETAFLRMRLDHDSGAVDGEVVAGDFAGRMLSSLARAEFDALLADCARDDPASARLLQAWRDRVRPEWRDGEAASATSTGPMTEAEALEVLGLERGATRDEIKAAHRRIMRSAHPDAGGSDWLAARVNAAKALLLGE